MFIRMRLFVFLVKLKTRSASSISHSSKVCAHFTYLVLSYILFVSSCAYLRVGVPKNIGTSAAAETGAGLIAADANASMRVLLSAFCAHLWLCAVGDKKFEDPCVFTLAYKKNRFFWFSTREPDDGESAGSTGRDVFNEKPTLDSKVAAPSSGSLGNLF